ncbi:calcium-binding protein [Streptomyces sp. NBC_01478]|uniref:calcium-binding protein n=1 Tax=Streptomyces sp. NBC_01478 TaxID=2903882 RepID=UPI002E2F1A64|nr:calcium-binding protein [Streptomyces sp. NBC_01478]
MPSRPLGRLVTLALGAGLAAPLFLAGTAGAATAPATAALANGDHEILYTAATGQANKAVVTATHVTGSDTITYVIDDVVTVKPGAGCAYPTASDHTKVSCTVTLLDSQDPYPTVELKLGDGNDTLSYHNRTGQTYFFASTDLGAGNDKYTEDGSVDGNYASGGTGNDTITLGKYSVGWGDNGNDTLHGGASTIAQGGNGNDTITTTGSAADGGAGNDVITAGAGNQSLTGGAGNDRIHGGAGNDFIYGGTGNDVLYGGAGADTIYGNSGNDTLWGGAGKDVLSGGPGRNVVHQN